MTDSLPRIALALGDPAGIGPEIALKAALDPAVRAVCRPLLFGDRGVVEAHASACGLKPKINSVAHAADAAWSGDGITLVERKQFDAGELRIGAIAAAHGKSALDSAKTAIDAALAGDVDAVVAAPHTESAIKLAGVEFDGYPSFVARETGTDENDVYLMLCFGDTRIVHCTLHQSVKDAIAVITPEKVARVIRAADRALRRLGIDAPKICVGGLNPHAGEGGLFGREEIEIIKPAIEDAAAEGIQVTGPVGADTLFHKKGCDAFIVMLHDQGHIVAKLLAQNAAAALTIGSPILFSSVAHGSALEIAGKNQASPRALIVAIRQLSGAKAATGD
ncbi:MAG: PdxA family dehydrogenase [Burkholderiales bacterium]